MASEPTPEFDLGPLSWVQGEIDQALTRGLDALAQFRAKPDDATTLKHARSHVHQAAGAIQMVGLDAVVAFTDELERQLSRLEDLPPAEDLLESGAQAPVIRMINALLLQALRERASDLHFEPYEARSVVRFRVDGVLRDVLEPPRALFSGAADVSIDAVNAVLSKIGEYRASDVA
jgi:general secretion pathway protein E